VPRSSTDIHCGESFENEGVRFVHELPVVDDWVSIAEGITLVVVKLAIADGIEQNVLSKPLTANAELAAVHVVPLVE